MSGLGLKLITAAFATSLAHAASQIVDVAVSSDGSASSLPADNSFVRGEQVLEASAAPTAGEVRDETVRTQPQSLKIEADGSGVSHHTRDFVNSKCKHMHLESQLVRMAMSAYNMGTLPLGGTNPESGLLFQSWQLEAFSINPFLGPFGAYWEEVGVAGVADHFEDCGWKEEYKGCFQLGESNTPCYSDTYNIIDDVQKSPNEHVRNYMVVYRNEKGNPFVDPNTCVIAFSGETDEADAIMMELPELDTQERETAGLPHEEGGRGKNTLRIFKPEISGQKEGVYGGFIMAYNEYKEFPDFKSKWIDFVTKTDKCSGGVIMTGHNLGGSIAMVHKLDYANYENGVYQATCFANKVACRFIVFGSPAPFYKNPPIEGDTTGKKSVATPGCYETDKTSCPNYDGVEPLCVDPLTSDKDCDPIVNDYPVFGSFCGDTKDKHIYLEEDYYPFLWQSKPSVFRYAFPNWEMWSHGTNVQQYKLFRSIGWSPWLGEKMVPTMLRHNCKNTPWDISSWYNHSADSLYREQDYGNQLWGYPSVLDLAVGFLRGDSDVPAVYGNKTPAWADDLWRLTPCPPGSISFTLYYWRHFPLAIAKAIVNAPWKAYSDMFNAVRDMFSRLTMEAIPDKSQRPEENEEENAGVNKEPETTTP